MVFRKAQDDTNSIGKDPEGRRAYPVRFCPIKTAERQGEV